MDTKYLFGIKKINKKTKIVVISSDDWLAKKYKYCFNLPKEIIDALDYYGYSNSIKSKDGNLFYIGEFVNEEENRPIDEIIKHLSHCPLLKHNEEIDKFLMTYFYYISEKKNNDSKLTIYIKSAIHFNSDISEDENNEELSSYLIKAGFKKCSNTVYKLDSYYNTKMDIYQKLKDFEYITKNYTFSYRCIQREKTIDNLFSKSRSYKKWF